MDETFAPPLASSPRQMSDSESQTPINIPARNLRQRRRQGPGRYVVHSDPEDDAASDDTEPPSWQSLDSDDVYQGEMTLEDPDEVVEEAL